ncbi:hypothetical protein [Micromonospora echinofusca]|uniref:Membrane domain of glycerophosphoryl diester phosphodiesterase n=1 Tax=Micromonospora echinofusca TaxID=47858 RepID=A0ABS3VMF3_MICEH|nr:hypothetical protein [Micromonospora echinofusca]MBO4205646.1 hypothetical protein [Micromonospora echinofusca]
MTTGELLDAATSLLRTRAPLLLGVGLLLALLEQALLFPLRQLADVVYVIFPDIDRLGWLYLLMVVGFATEAVIIAVLGALSSAAAPRALLGPATPLRRVRPVRVAVVAVVVAVLAALAATTVVLGPVPYLLLGLAVPAVVIDGLGPGAALLRSVRLTGRRGLRAGWIRLLGYLSWLVIRLATGLGGWFALSLLIDTDTAARDHLVASLAWLAVNAVAYPALACLDTVLHVETRMRTEGLDIALSRAARRGVTADQVLAVPR